ncbi:uncharacterized protein MEPE_04002 [Melanopsichium pennsylvanicum]|uniref:Uncharacterized protein n=1 Tax=Melanopsichium pennsylvanicum TaxID=63383 RepID=A0AAJ4XNA7_9BASI|nr:uncharacterized protein MEPE_04002 [Melanopsichium pennsylvanicum]
MMKMNFVALPSEERQSICYSAVGFQAPNLAASLGLGGDNLQYGTAPAKVYTKDKSSHDKIQKGHFCRSRRMPACWSASELDSSSPVKRGWMVCKVI